MYTLCIAEKPSVAEEIAKNVGATRKNAKEGYYEGNGYLVTWCVGHLITLAEPETYNDAFKVWSMEVLPIIPQKWKLEVIEATKTQFNNVKALINRDDVELVVDCGDMGAQGHYIQWLVRLMSGCKKPVKKLCATSITSREIQRAFTCLRDINEFTYIIAGQYCKAKSDWIIGMCLSRYFSVKYRDNLNKGEVLSVGRVQTPTWNFVVERYYEINNFVPKPYYQIHIALDNGVKAVYFNENDNKIMEEAVAKDVVRELLAVKQVRVKEVSKEEKKLNRPQLYDITELQRDGSRLWNYSPDEVLDTMQSLYDKKLLTYPRTDSRYITTDVASEMTDRIREIAFIEEYRAFAEKLLQKGLNLDKRVVNNEKVTDHHAVLVTENIKDVDFDSLNQKERNILHAVIRRMLISFDEQMEFHETRVFFSTPDNKHEFRALGKTITKAGWKGVEKLLLKSEETEKESKELLLPVMEKGDVFKVADANTLSKKTNPPLPYTYDTLLTAMENAGDKIQIDDEMMATGLGTGATRAGIVKELFNKGYLETVTSKKNVYIQPTQKALFAHTVFPKQLLNPDLTARWQYKITMIEKKQLSSDAFMAETVQFVKDVIAEAEQSTATYQGLFTDNAESVGKCRWCGKNVYQRRSVYRCENDECGFYISTEKNPISLFYYKNTLSHEQVKLLLSSSGLTLKCKNKQDVEYKANFKIKSKPKVDGEKKYIDIDMSFVNDKKQSHGGKKGKMPSGFKKVDGMRFG